MGFPGVLIAFCKCCVWLWRDVAGTSARCGHYVAFAKLQGTDDGNGNTFQAATPLAMLRAVFVLSRPCASPCPDLHHHPGCLWQEMNFGWN